LLAQQPQSSLRNTQTQGGLCGTPMISLAQYIVLFCKTHRDGEILQMMAAVKMTTCLLVKWTQAILRYQLYYRYSETKTL